MSAINVDSAAPRVPEAQAAPSSGMAVIALVLGVLGATLSLSSRITAVGGLVLGILAVVLGWAAFARARSSGTERAIATAGLAIGAAACCLSLLGVVMLGNGATALDRAFQSFANNVGLFGE